MSQPAEGIRRWSVRAGISLVRVGIPDFDVEPAVGPRSWAVVLGVVSVLAGVLAVIGWPLPVVSGRYTQDPLAWELTVGAVEDWLAHDGWRMSGTSWVHGAVAVAALAGAVVLLRPAWSGVRKAVVVVVPAGLLLVLGPAVQWALGLPWSNYEDRSTGAMALGILVAVTVGVGAAVIAAAVRRGRPDDVDAPFGGRRRP
ncbi:hypothetical protein BIU97_06230 [Curtobacterium sp. MCBA15_009]|uniref:hypothetical protein n=1 Tax=Curtobacterium sp. MCBA15_009 TaxID=1898737 RepID=UPI0008DD38C4|nr:hypothetical protein [Curtobacterium sp. MCBA15_009]OII11485.1 hypothetical protein BIU97_06230 [Curtobacterium sp. MCBA15_009]